MRGMRLIAVVAILGACLVMPSLLAAQETPPAEEPAAEEPVADEEAVAEEQASPEVDAVVVEQETGSGGEKATAEASQGESRARGTATASASTIVKAGDFFFKPKTVHIEVGDTVTWKNVGQAPHTSTANDNSFDTGLYDPGESRSHTFTEAGTIDYICTLHPQMTGTVVVAGASGAGDPDEPASNDGAPAVGDDGGTSVAPAESESAAVESASAAGTNSSLPATGEDTWLLALTGLELLAAGFLLGRLVGARVRPG